LAATAHTRTKPELRAGPPPAQAGQVFPWPFYVLALLCPGPSMSWPFYVLALLCPGPFCGPFVPMSVALPMAAWVIMYGCLCQNVLMQFMDACFRTYGCHRLCLCTRIPVSECAPLAPWWAAWVGQNPAAPSTALIILHAACIVIILFLPHYNL